MRPFNSRVTQPTPTERVLSILTAAHSMTVVSDGLDPVEVHRLDGTAAMGHIHLHEPSEAGSPQPRPDPRSRGRASPSGWSSPTSRPRPCGTARAPASR